MGNEGPADGLERLLAERGDHLMRAAMLLTGGKEAAEDLLQAALERLLRHRRDVVGDPEGYLRRTMYHLAVDGWRRRALWRAKAMLLSRISEETTTDANDEVELRDSLIRLLLRLPPRQRAVIVLRYWEQLSEVETARTLGCSVGNVKSAASRGLRRLRELSEGAGTDIRRMEAAA